MKRLIELAKAKYPPEYFETISLYEVFPGTNAFAGCFESGVLKTKVMHWGLAMGKKQVINARSETAFTSPFFSLCRPCTLAATSYDEWEKKTKVRYRIKTEESPFYLAGLYRKENGVDSFVILTKEASSVQKEIHHREPVILSYKDAKDWCRYGSPSLLVNNNVNERSMHIV